MKSISFSLLYVRAVALFGCLFVALTATAAEKSIAVSDLPVAKDTLPNALLWKIEGNGLNKSSYLFGTIHIIPKEDYFLPAGFEKAFSETENVVFEIDMAEMNDMSSLMGLMGSLMMNNGMSLDQLLTTEEYSKVSEYFEEMGLPIFLLNRVKPMFLSVLTELNMDMTDIQSDMLVSYENEIFEMAKKENKTTGGLESMEFQLSLFDSIPYQDQAKMLVDAIQNLDAPEEAYDQTNDMYKDQNIQGMVEMINSDEGIGGFENLLLDNRNKAWIPIMESIMQTKSSFFAVGAGHLAGPSGVISLLRSKGYKLTPVSIQKPRSKKA